MRPSNHLILYYPLLLLPSSSPSIRVFSNEFVLQKGISILEQLLAGRGRLRLLFKMGAKVIFGVCQRNDIVEKRTLMIFSTLFWYFRSLSVLLKTVFISLMGFFFTFFFLQKSYLWLSHFFHLLFQESHLKNNREVQNLFPRFMLENCLNCFLLPKFSSVGWLPMNWGIEFFSVLLIIVFTSGCCLVFLLCCVADTAEGEEPIL